MSCKQKLKEMFLKCDIFSTSEFLRYNDEPEYRTYTGAFCSLVTVIVFCGIFMNVMISTFAKTQIIWSLNIIDVGADEFQVVTQVQGQNKFMFAVSLSGYDLNNDTQRMFDVSFVLRKKINSVSQPDQSIPLQQCTPAHWNVNDQFLQTYYRMNFSKMLCPQIGFRIPIQGKFTSQIFRYAQIRIVKCTSNATKSNKTCANESQLVNKTFYYNLYFLNTLINPQSSEYISYYIEDRNYIQFTTSLTSLVNVFVSNYQITTDQSITPFKQQRYEQGAMINSLGQVIPRQNDGTTYASIVLRRSSTTIQTNRSFKRVDDTLSYIGGLFGFALIMLIFMKEYTQYSFQIDASSYLYYHDHQQPPSHTFNFLIFVGYIIYLLLDSLGFKPNWKTMQALDQCRQEIQKQFDVRFLFERVNHLEKSLNHLFSDSQSKFLHLLRKPTILEASKLRESYKLKYVLMERGGKNQHQVTENPLNNTEDIITSPNKPRYANKVYPQNGQDNDFSPQDGSSTKQPGILSKIKTHFKVLHKETIEGGHISKKIIQDLDPNIIKIIYEGQSDDKSGRSKGVDQCSLEKIEKSYLQSRRDKKSGRKDEIIIKEDQQHVELQQSWNENHIIQQYTTQKEEHHFDFIN